MNDESPLVSGAKPAPLETRLQVLALAILAVAWATWELIGAVQSFAAGPA